MRTIQVVITYINHSPWYWWL